MRSKDASALKGPEVFERIPQRTARRALHRVRHLATVIWRHGARTGGFARARLENYALRYLVPRAWPVRLTFLAANKAFIGLMRLLVATRIALPISSMRMPSSPP